MRKLTILGVKKTAPSPPERRDNKSRLIKVSYNGKYPNACSGVLCIEVDGAVIYAEKYACRSTGDVKFDSDWNAEVKQGKLLWNEDEAAKFDEEIQEAVRAELSKVHVCCGGCV